MRVRKDDLVGSRSQPRFDDRVESLYRGAAGSLG